MILRIFANRNIKQSVPYEYNGKHSIQHASGGKCNITFRACEDEIHHAEKTQNVCRGIFWQGVEET